MFSGELTTAAISAVPLGALPEVHQLHAIRLRRDQLEVTLDRISRGQPTIGAEAETEVRVRRGNLGGRRRCERQERAQHQGMSPEQVHRRMIPERLSCSFSSACVSASCCSRVSNAEKPHCSGS